MTAVFGFTLVGIIVGLLLFRIVSPIAVFATLPVIMALALGTPLDSLSDMASEGVESVAPTAFLFIFAIVFFGLMRDRGLFDPLIRFVLSRVGDRPVRVTVSTVIVAAIAHLDGLGAATFLLTIPAFLPIYKRMGMNPLNLVMLVGLAAGVINIVPWAGTTVRAAAATGVDAIDLWVPLIPVQAFGILVVLTIAVIVGLREQSKIRRKSPAGTTTEAERLEYSQVTADAGLSTLGGAKADPEVESVESGCGEIEESVRTAGTISQSGPDHRQAEPDLFDRPNGLSPRAWRYWANLALTVGTVTALIMQLLPFYLCFMIALGIGLVLNYSKAPDQDRSIASHAKEALAMGALIVTVGMFLGIMNGTGALDDMGAALVAVLPEAAGSKLHVIVGVLGVPLGMVFGPDPYYFGILPLVQEVVGAHGVPAESVASAMLIGENTGFAVSPVVPTVYLALGLANVELGRHIRHSFLWFWGLSILMLIMAVFIGVVKT